MIRLSFFKHLGRSLEILCFSLLILLSLSTRLLSTTKYDFTEDEIFAREFNQVHTFTGLLTAPDFDHPPLWYMSMDFLVDQNPSEFLLRLVQILLFTTALGVSFWLLSPFPLKYRMLPLGWLALNPYVIHLTAGYLMYASVLGATVVSFSWILRLLWFAEKKKTDPSMRQVVCLSLLMSAGLLLDYSFFLFSCFLLVFAGLSWVQKRSEIWKSIVLSVVLSGLIDIWYLPIFWKNLFLTARANQWAPVPSLKEFIFLMGDLFGFVDNVAFKWVFVSGSILIFILILIGILQAKEHRQKSSFSFLSNQWIAIVGMITAFVILCLFFKNSFFYARVCFTFIVPLTFTLIFTLIPNFKKNFFLTTALLLFIFLTTFSFLDYYKNSTSYYWDFHDHPLKVLLNQSFPPNSCVFSTPDWIHSSITSNLPKQSNMRLLNGKTLENVENCESYFFIDQTSILKKTRESSLQQIKDWYGVCFSSKVRMIQDNVVLRQCS